MTINTQDRTAGPFAGNDVATVFPFEFKVFQSSDLLVFLTVGSASPNTLVLDFDYSVTLNADQNANPGGSVILLGGALATGSTLDITSSIAATQMTELTNQGGFFPKVIENALDRLTILIQQASLLGPQALRVPPTESVQAIPAKTQRASSLLGFDEDGQPKIYPSDIPEIIDGIARAEAAADAAQASEIAAAGSASQSASSANSAEQFKNQAQAARDAAVANANLYPDEPTGRAATADGASFLVQGGGNIAAYIYRRNNSASSTLLTTLTSGSIDALSINSGKPYPLQARVRDGITSLAHVNWNALLLDALVINARPGKLYQTSYYQNGAVIGVAGYGWIIREFDESTFATASGAGRVIVDFNDLSKNQIDRSGGIQVIRLESSDGIVIELTVDPAGLPPDGGPINSNSGSTQAAWSWVIHPDCYQRVERCVQNARRNNVRSAGNSFLEGAIVDVVLLGARPGKKYGFRYFKNGTTALVGPQDGWIIEEQDAETYETTASALTVVNFTDPAPDIVRSGIQTITVNSPVVAGLQFIITIDTTKLPAFGTFVQMNGPTNPGYSWIINPAKYVVWPDAIGSRMSWRTTASKLILVTWQSSDRWYRIEIGPNGKNNLPNIRQLWTASRTGRAAGAWSLLWSGSTDWLPPLRCWAVSGGVDLPAGRIFTGGNHGSDGGSGGDMTAANVMWDCIIDGAPVKWEDASGNAERITLRIVNDVRAANTIATTPPRYVLREHFAVAITASGIGLTAERVALEDILVLTDYGVQAVTNGFQSDMLFVGGTDSSWVTYSTDKTAGTKAVSPNAWACILRSSNGELALWQDREFKDGDGKYVNADWPIFKGGGGSNHKVYGGVIGRADINAGAPATFATGGRWSWRGGWSFQAPGLAPAGMDAVMQLQRPGGGIALMSDAQNWAIL